MLVWVAIKKKLATCSNEIMSTILVQQQQIFYTAGPAGAGPHLLLVHGAGGSHRDWPEQLRQRPNVLAIDLPGHHLSALPGRTTVNDYATFVIDFIHQLGLQQVVVAGHSMGGAIAQTIGLLRPEAVMGLIMVGSGARLRVHEAILGQILSNLAGAVDFITANEWAPDTPSELKRSGREQLLANDPTVMYHDYTACNQFDLITQLDQIRLPTLVISGTADRMTPLKYGQFLADHIPKAKFAIIEGGGHKMALEQPESITHTILEELRVMSS